MSNKEIILLVFFLISFLYCLKNSSENILLLLIFLIPLGDIFNFQVISIGLSGILVWSVWLSNQVRYETEIKFSIWKLISPKIYWLHYFLFTGVLVALLAVPNQINVDKYYFQIYKHSLNIITILMLIKILLKYRQDTTFQTKMLYAFNLSIFYNLFSIMLENLGFGGILISVSKMVYIDQDLQSEVERYSGFFGDYELIIDYSMIVIVLSLLLIIRDKKIIPNTLIIVSALIVGLLSGTRSFVILIPIFLLISIAIGYYHKVFNFRIIFLILGLSFLSFSLSIYLKEISVFRRLESAFDTAVNKNEYTTASNRNFDNVVNKIIQNRVILGDGSLDNFIWQGDAMTSHNLFIHTYSRYGIIGFLTLLILFWKITWSLFYIVKNQRNKRTKIEAILFLSLIITLFIQEQKISFIRYLNSMLVYTFLFMLIFYFLQTHKKNIRIEAY
jgi:hypothetical protein